MEAVEVIRMPTRGRGRPSAKAEARYWAEVREWAAGIKEIASRLDFSPSSRGWCYVMEEFGLTKDQFDTCQKLINDCRKRGILPLDITAEDGRRQFHNLEEIDDESPKEFAHRLLEWAYGTADEYFPWSFWGDQEFYVEMLVEKVDLKSLFLSICAEFKIPIANGAGWSDFHTRANMMKRFSYWEGEGNTPVLLYCGDLDPKGLQISDTLMSNLKELEGAVGWDPSGLVVDRFGLNLDFVEENDLSWVNNLITGSGKDLADPNHKEHKLDYVQNWLKKIGPRKVEANALVTRPEAGRQLCFDAITKYVDPDAPEAYREKVRSEQDAVRLTLDEMVPEAPWK